MSQYQQVTDPAVLGRLLGSNSPSNNVPVPINSPSVQVVTDPGVLSRVLNTPEPSTLSQLGSLNNLTANVGWNFAKSIPAGFGTALQGVGTTIRNAVNDVAPSSSPSSPLLNTVLNTNLNQKLGVPSNAINDFGNQVGAVIPGMAMPEMEAAPILSRIAGQGVYGYASNPNSPIKSGLTYAAGQGIGDAIPAIGSLASSAAEKMTNNQYAQNLVTQLKSIYQDAQNTALGGFPTLGANLKNMANQAKSNTAELYGNVAQGAQNLNNGNVINLTDPSTAGTSIVMGKPLAIVNGNRDVTANWNNLTPIQQQYYLGNGYAKEIPNPSSSISSQIQSVIPSDVHSLLLKDPTTKTLYTNILNGKAPPSFENFDELKQGMNSGYGNVQGTDMRARQEQAAYGNAANFINSNLLYPHLQAIDDATNSNLVGQYATANLTHAREVTPFQNSSYKVLQGAGSPIENPALGVTYNPSAQDIATDIGKGISTKGGGTLSNPTPVISHDSAVAQLYPAVNQMASFESSPDLMAIINGKNNSYSASDLQNALSNANLENSPQLQAFHDALEAKNKGAQNTGNKAINTIGTTAAILHPAAAPFLLGNGVRQNAFNSLTKTLGNTGKVFNVLSKYKIPQVARIGGTAAVNNLFTNNQ